MAKSRIHSVLTALPVLMLMIGLGYYFHTERLQRDGSPVLEESKLVQATVDGLSVIKSISANKPGKHYFWFLVDGQRRGARISVAASELLQPLEKGDAVVIALAPMVAGSKNLWAYQVSRDGVELLPAIEKSQEQPQN